VSRPHATHGQRLGWWLVVVVVAAVVAAAPGTWIASTYGAHLSVDEPHYLLTAMALAEDGSLDIAELHDEERYRPFHQVRLPAQAARTADGRMVAPHDPLLPALLALPWRLGGWQGARLALAAMNGALAALLLWTAVRRFAIRPGPAAGLVGLAVASAPLAAYGSQLYPELPAALAVTGAVAAATGKPGWRTVAALVVAVVALPWLAVKYVPVAAALAAVAGWRWWRLGARRHVGAAAAIALLAGVVYVVAHLRWYGGLTVYAAGDFFREQGGELTVVGTSPDYLGRSRRLVGLFVDEGFGIAAWQPLWLLALPAVGWMLRRRPDGTALVLIPAAAGWLTATFVALTMHGWWFPGRQVVVVLPLLLLAVLGFVDGRPPRTRVALALGTLGVGTWAWLVVEGLQRRLTLIVDFASTTNPWFQAWQVALPDYLRPSTPTWVLHGVWVVLAIAAAWWGWSHGQRPHPREGAGAEPSAGAPPQPVNSPTSSAEMPRSS
jgi:hypothetical protein